MFKDSEGDAYSGRRIDQSQENHPGFIITASSDGERGAGGWVGG